MIPQRIAASQTLALLQKVRDLKASGADLVSFAAGESDFETPPEVVEAAYVSMKNGNTRYVNTQGLPQLREALAGDMKKRFSNDWIGPENISVCAGAKQGIHLALSALLDPGDEVLIPAPYWVSYPGIVKSVRGEAKKFSTQIENSYFPTVKELDAQYTAKSKALIIASPSNPTGGMIDGKQLGEIVDWCINKKVLLIMDELYERLTFGDKKHESVLSMISQEQSEWVLSVNAFSKAFSMTGWRLGFLTSHPDNIKALSALQSQVLTCLPGFVQEAAIAALENADSYLEPVLASFRKRRDLFMSLMEEVPYVKAFPPEAAFYVMVDVSEAMKRKGISEDLVFVEKLLDEGKVALNSAASFGMPGQVRFTFALAEDEIREGIKRFSQFVQSN